MFGSYRGLKAEGYFPKILKLIIAVNQSAFHNGNLNPERSDFVLVEWQCSQVHHRHMRVSYKPVVDALRKRPEGDSGEWDKAERV